MALTIVQEKASVLAFAVLAVAETAFVKLGDEAGLKSVAELRRLIEERKNALGSNR